MPEYVPSYLDPSNLVRLYGEHYAVTFDTVSEDFYKVKKSTLTHIDDIRSKGYDGVRGELDNLWVTIRPRPSDHRIPVAVDEFRVKYPDPRDYFNTLDVVTDLPTYIRLLASYKAAGVTLKKIAVPPPPRIPTADRHPIAVYGDYFPESGYTEYGPPSNPNLQLYLPAWEKGDVGYRYLPSEPPINTYGSPSGRADKFEKLLTDDYVIFTYPQLFKNQSQVSNHRFLYARACKEGFAEILTYQYLQRTLDMLRTAVQDDLPTVINNYNVFYNRMLHDVNLMIDMTVTVETVLLNPPRTHEGSTTERVWQCQIPDDIVNGPEVTYDTSWTSPQFSDSEGTIILPEKHFPAGVYTCRAAMHRELRAALQLLVINYEDMEARISALSDKTLSQEETRYSSDPYSNAFLVFDAEQSVKSGKVTFQNLAFNLNRPGVNSSVVMPIDFKGARVSDYLAAPEIRSQFTRQRVLEYGGSLSRNDLENSGYLPKSKSIVPYLAGGAIAAYLLSQAI